MGGAPTIAEPDQSSKLRPGPALQNPIVHLDPIWQHLARAHSAKPDPGATLQNPTRAYSAEPDLTNRDPSRQPASQPEPEPASQPVDLDPCAGQLPGSQPATAWRLAGCLSWVTPGFPVTAVDHFHGDFHSIFTAIFTVIFTAIFRAPRCHGKSHYGC